MQDEPTAGQKTIAEMKDECSYDEMEDTGVDSLIDYKNALEDRLLTAIDGDGVAMSNIARAANAPGATEESVGRMALQALTHAGRDHPWAVSER